MATYPGLPDNRLIVNGTDITETYGLVLLDGYTLSPPSPKTYTVDIPGGNGVIDLTEALTGDVAYENRKQSFDFAIIDPSMGFETAKTKISNFLHGRAFDYTMTMDPGYTYHGRFTVSSYSHEVYANGFVGTIKVDIDANPYKRKEQPAYRLNATGGKLFRFESGRRPVHPVIECSQPCFVTWKDIEYTVPAGTHRLNDVTFTEGFNEIYINSYKIWYVTWNSFADGTRTWDDAKALRWDEIQKINGDLKDTPMSWNDLYATRWSELSETKYEQLDYGKQEDLPESIVYLKYDWEDL